MQDYFRLAERFAKALDCEEYGTALTLLNSECEYTCRGKILHGAAEIIDSYQGNGEAAKRFDSVAYESEVIAQGNGRFRILFTDHLVLDGRQFTFRCEQIIEFNDGGEVIRITHFDLPGQVEALAKFKAAL